MLTLRRIGLLALVLGFAQVVFGAIVRITGSGMGCGDHWPDCFGSFTPAHSGPTLLVEISHRYGAAALSLAIVALVVAAWVKRREPGVAGRGRSLARVIARNRARRRRGAVRRRHRQAGASSVGRGHPPRHRDGAARGTRRRGRAGRRVWRAVDRRTVRSNASRRQSGGGPHFSRAGVGRAHGQHAGAPLSCQGFPWCRVDR